MFRRLFATTAMLALGVGAAAEARAEEPARAGFRLAAAPAASFLAVTATPDAADIQRAAEIQRLVPPVARAPRRTSSTALLNSLYVSTIAMQALDVHSTLSAMRSGAVEGNPLMAGVAGHRAAFIAVKAGVAASTVFAAQKLAKHNKVAAIVTLMAINSAYAYVVNHNYRIGRGID